jgi:O-antigen/teichoic acid export membrane protein
MITIVANAFSVIVVARGLPWRRITVAIRTLIEELRFGIKVHLTALLGFANFRLDVLFMSAIVSASQIGYYGVANNVMIPVSSIAAAAAIIMTPTVARFGGNDVSPERQLAFIRREAFVYLSLATAGGVALALASPFLLPLVFGPTFEPAIVLVWILIPGYIARSFTLILVSGTVGMRRSAVGNAAEGAGLVVTVSLLPVLLPRYEAIGASVVSTIAYGSSAVVAWLGFRRVSRSLIGTTSRTSGNRRFGLSRIIGG